MRKLSLIAANVFLAATVLFTSCKKEDESTSGPSVGFIADEGYVTSSTTLNPGDEFMVKVNAEQGDAELESFFVTVMNEQDDELVISESDIMFSGLTDRTQVTGSVAQLRGDDQEGFNADISITAPSSTGVYTYSFTAIDKDEVSTTKTITITVEGEVEFTEYTNMTLGAQGAAEGSYYASSNGEVYSSSEFAANISIIDITYAQTGATDITISDKILSSAAREDEDLTSGTGGIESYFRISSMNYTTATGADIAAITQPSSQIVEVNEGDVVEFVSSTGNKGLIMINSITNPDDSDFEGMMNISIKVVE